MISSGLRAFFTIINRPFASISADRAFSEAEMKKSSRAWPSYFGWSLTNTPMIPELFRASKIPAMFGMYCRCSSRAVTRRTVSSETFPVFPWITLETVAVLRPSSWAMSRIRTRFSIGFLPFTIIHIV